MWQSCNDLDDFAGKASVYGSLGGSLRLPRANVARQNGLTPGGVATGVSFEHLNHTFHKQPGYVDLDAEDPDAFDLGAKGKHRKRLNSVLKFFTMFQKKEFQDEEGELGRLADLPVGSPSLGLFNDLEEPVEPVQEKVLPKFKKEQLNLNVKPEVPVVAEVTSAPPTASTPPP
eukprot:CAMPEP_0114235746 /NCGR_PEP_ID=MMETSP0058-20121206/6423_1 /TAXON_ID=36894 /ORGANISM="Pyramimonas parkeae, CCMP726" /LENGTH=172 /DNA_ID=CAMNT_0001347545 /DNA_START=470 /DNA_END=985 /DNA_ORIENTATION=-